MKPEFVKSFSFFASSLSFSIISLISTSSFVLGDQPKLILAFFESPKRKSTSVGLKYLGSTFITTSNVSALLPTSFKPSPSHIIPDLPSSKLELDKLDLKSHYSDKASKIWFYVEIDSQVDYRIEIRWKGDPFA